jgi:hypothetical protein
MDTPRRVPSREHAPRRSCAVSAQRRRARAAAALLVLGPLLWIGTGCRSGPLRSEYGRTLYQWSDASGNVRYTTYAERVPVQHLIAMKQVKPGRSAEENAALLPGARAPQVVDANAAGRPLASADGPDIADLDRRIAELEVAVARDEEILKLLISDPDAAEGLRSSEELSEISRRLPERQAELRALREERAHAADGHAP